MLVSLLFPFSHNMFFVKKVSSILFHKAPRIVHFCSTSSAKSQLLRMASTLPKSPIFEAIASHDPQSTVVIHSSSGRRFTYGELLRDVAEAKDKLLQNAEGPIKGARIAFLVENSYDYVGAQSQELSTDRTKLIEL
jgi:hypothetical protein